MLTCLDKYHDFLHVRGKNNISSTLLSLFGYKSLGQKVIQGTTICDFNRINRKVIDILGGHTVEKIKLKQLVKKI